MSHLITVEHHSERITVHPDLLAMHRALGWREVEAVAPIEAEEAPATVAEPKPKRGRKNGTSD